MKAKFIERLGFRLLLTRPPVRSRHVELTMLCFVEPDAPSKPSARLIEIALAAAQAAQKVDLSDVGSRIGDGIDLVNIWPGEHYKLLAGLVSVLKPKLIVEIGTATGSSALTLKKLQPSGGRLVTFDIMPWASYPGSILNDADFADGSLQQYVDDISQTDGFVKHKSLLAEADLIFIDAAKDGIQEQLFLDNFDSINFRHAPLLVFDDIRLWNMLRIWNEIRHPKLDLTSFGHWSGTGFVEWSRSENPIGT